MPSDVVGRSQAPPPLVTVSCALVSYIHTVCGFLAFGGALAVALSLHYELVVKNGIARYPDEWWPSVSATIGDWYPERNVFQIGIALMSGPRFLLVMLSSLLVSLSKPTSSHARILLFIGVLRTLSCAGWVYITSTDDHDVHDIAMILYLVCTPAWMYISSGSLASAGGDSAREALADKARRMRRRAAVGFWSMIPPMVFFFYRHKVLRIPGAYTIYSFFEWGLIIFDLLFDFASVYDLSRLEIHIVEAPRPAGPAGSASAAHSSAGLFGGAWLGGGTAAAVKAGAWSTPPSLSLGAKESSSGSSKLAAEAAPLDEGFKGHAAVSEAEPLRDAASFAADVYLGFCFWSTLTALHPAIFFFSVYNMGIGGHEALLVAQVLGLALTMVPAIRKTLLNERQGIASVGPRSRSVDAVLHVLSLSGLTVWWIQDPLVRLLATAVGAVGFAIQTALEWGRAWETDDLQRTSTAWILGLLLSSLAKYANHSNNPVWPFLHAGNGGHNVVGLVLAVAATAERISRPQQQAAAGRSARRAESWSSAFTAAAGMGALIYALHTFLSDSGTMIAWTWTGWPVKGPMAIPHGVIILAASGISLLASLAIPGLGVNPLFFAAGSGVSFVLLRFEDWTGFYGALGVAAFLPPLAGPIISATMRHHPLRIMIGAWLVADLLTFFSVLTAAYAFVPGGQVFREHSGAMMIGQLVLLAAGLLRARSSPGAHRLRAGFSKHSARLASLSAPIVVFMTLAARAVASLRGVPETSIVPYHAPDRLFTAGIWTVHFGLDQSMYDSSRRMSNLLKDMEVDVFGLLETDLHRSVFGNRDLTQHLAESLGMYADIGPGPDKHTWGCVLLSKFPIVNSTHYLLPSPHGELAPAIHAVLDIYGVHTHVVVSHNGQEEDPLDRELQSTEIARILRDAYPAPAILLAYVVTHPHAERPAPYKIIFEDGKIHDVHAGDDGRWCQYLGFRGLERVGYVRVSRYTVTDTELQTMKLVVPPIGALLNPDVDSRPHIVGDEHIPATWRYPAKFIDPPAMVYNKHKYSPWYYPLAFVPQPPA